MRVAALCDIHGNLPALDAVLAEVDRAGIDLIVAGGDVVSGPLPRETLGRLTGLGGRIRYVRGNADREAVAAFDAPGAAEPDDPARFTAVALGRPGRDVLAGFPKTLIVDVDGLGEVCFCHGSPRSDSEIITTASPDARVASILADVRESVVVGGHTHRQFDRRVGRWRVVNAGSVGMPYEGRPGAFWAILGPDVELRCTPYDVDAALEQLRAGGFAGTEALLHESLIEPADPDGVAAYFESQAG